MKKQLLLAALGTLLAVAGYAQKLPPAPIKGIELYKAIFAPALARVAGMEPEQMLVQNYETDTWQNAGRTVYSRYTANSLPGRLRTDTWRGADWVPTAENRRQYNAAGDVMSDTLVSFQPDPLVYAAITYKYGNGVLLQQQQDVLNPETQLWEPASRDTRTYNPAKQLLEVLQENYSAPDYDTLARSRYRYNAQGNLVELYLESRAGKSWETEQKITLTYDAQNRLTTLTSQLSLEGSYKNFQRELYQYDANDKITQVVYEDWDNDTWNKYKRSILTYTTQGYPLMNALETWSGSEYQKTQRTIFTYRAVTSTQSATSLLAQLTVAPNPLAGAATIRYTLPATAPVTVEVLDLLGRPVRRLVPTQAQVAGVHTVPFTREGLSAGLYVVRLTAGFRSQQLKIVVE